MRLIPHWNIQKRNKVNWGNTLKISFKFIAKRLYHASFFFRNKMRYLSFVKKSTILFLIMIIIGVVFISCSSQKYHEKENRKHKEEISDGLRKGNIIYFLCDYCFSNRYNDHTMYLYSPGDIYYTRYFFTRLIFLWKGSRASQIWSPHLPIKAGER